MASLICDSGNRWRIQFVFQDVRRTIRLGKMPRRAAEAVRRHIEALIASRLSGQAPDAATAAWLGGLPTDSPLRGRLAAVGLVEAPKRVVLGEFLRQYILARPDVKPATLEVWQQPCRNLTEFFGEDKPLRDITAGDAERFAQWLRTQKLAAATVAKRLAFARTFFHVARKHKLIAENPFSEVKAPTADVSARQRFIDRETIQRLLNIANPTWRTIIALVRFDGLRCPSEVLSLEWRHVDWERGRLTIPSPKTERYGGKGSREVPLFPELRLALTEAHELAEPTDSYVVGGATGRTYRAAATRHAGHWRNSNLRTSFEKLVRRAGLEPWPRLFHNLRSSCETELLGRFPLHVVAQWMGHDAKISVKHYAQTTDEHFRQAVEADAKSGALVAQNAAQPAQASDAQAMTKTAEVVIGREDRHSLASADATCSNVQTEGEGFEPTSKSPRIPHFSKIALQKAMHSRSATPSCCRWYGPGLICRTRSVWLSLPWCGRVSRDAAWFLPGDGPKVPAVGTVARVDTLSFPCPNFHVGGGPADMANPTVNG